LTWQVEIKDQARKELRALDRQVQRQILQYLNKRIKTNEDPRRFGKALTNDKSGLWRYRVGDYRIICEIKDNTLVVLVLRIAHRKEVYD
jgi:mRNA interferase RelE/StbE